MSMSKMHDYLVFCRIHTVAWTSSLLLLGVLLAGQPLFSEASLHWWVAGLLWHAHGFAHNNFMDHELDQRNTHKAKHPHVCGRIGLKNSGLVTLYIAVIGTIYIMWISNNQWWAYRFFIWGVLAGWIYNTYSKRHAFAGIYAGLSYMFLPLLSYTALTGDPFNPLVWAVAFFIFAQAVHQIAWLGSIKDFWTDPHNSIHAMKKPRRWFIAMRILILCSILAFPFVIAYDMNVEQWLLWILVMYLFVAMCFYGYSIYWKNAVTSFSGHEPMKKGSIHEMIMLIILLILVAPVIGGLLISFAIFMIAIVWFVVWNRIYWKTSIHPKV